MGPMHSGLREFEWLAAAWGGPASVSLLGTMNAEARPGREVLLVIDDLESFENVTGFKEATAYLEENPSVKLVVGMTGLPWVSNVAISRARNAGGLLYLQPASAREVAERVGLTRLPPIRLGLDMPQGRGIYMHRRSPTYLQAFAPLNP